MTFVPLYLSVVSLAGLNGVLYEYPRNCDYINNQCELTKWEVRSLRYETHLNAFLCHSFSFMTLPVLAPFGCGHFKILNSFRKPNGILKL